jgi:hypothetical protein
MLLRRTPHQKFCPSLTLRAHIKLFVKSPQRHLQRDNATLTNLLLCSREFFGMGHQDREARITMERFQIVVFFHGNRYGRS